MSSEDLTQLALHVCAQRHRTKPLPPLAAEFYPYADLNHTIRLRDGRIYLRISDIMIDAPVWALQAIVAIMLLKLERRKIDPRLQAAYRAYAESREVRETVHRIRRARGRKIACLKEGRFFDLQGSFDRLNAHYFAGGLCVSTLTWSRRKTRRILGHYDRCHDVIVISRSLDAAWVPPLLFEFILFHEMLHAHLGDRHYAGKRYSHHREFRTAEKKFESYREAQRLMKEFSARIL